MDEKKLLKYAVDYLSKYDSSKNNLVSVLKRKILRLNLTNFEKKKLIDFIESINYVKVGSGKSGLGNLKSEIKIPENIKEDIQTLLK